MDHKDKMEKKEAGGIPYEGSREWLMRPPQKLVTSQRIVCIDPGTNSSRILSHTASHCRRLLIKELHAPRAVVLLLGMTNPSLLWFVRAAWTLARLPRSLVSRYAGGTLPWLSEVDWFPAGTKVNLLPMGRMR